MVKKKVKKKVSKTDCKPCKPSCKLCKPAFMYGAIAVFILALIALNFVSVGGGMTGAVTGAQTSTIDNLFNKWEGGQIDANIAKYTLFGMLALLIFSILNAAKFPKHIGVQAIIAAPIAFLATAFITPKEVMSILGTYSALGITLSMVLPFMIMLFFSSMLLSYERGRMSVAKIMFSVFTWFLFTIVLLYRLIYGFIYEEISIGLNWTFIITIVIFLLTLGIFVFNRRFRGAIMRFGLEIRVWEARYERLNAARGQRLARQVEEGSVGAGLGSSEESPFFGE